MGSALFTDHYELTMIDAALADGTAHRRSVFEAYFRRPANRFADLAGLTALGEYAVMAGAARIVNSVSSFRFGEDDLEFLRSRRILSERAIDWLERYRFNGTLILAEDGERIDPQVPVLTARGTFAECIILETLVLSVLNSDSSIATRAMQLRTVAGPDATLIEMGSRRTHEQHAVAAAQAAYIGGFDTTSNLEAGKVFGVPTAGTAAHAWTLAHLEDSATASGLSEGEARAFRSQIQTLGVDTTLLVDTFDIPGGIVRAVEAARQFGAEGPGAIRIDSGDLASESKRARQQLDDLGANRTRIVASGDLDVRTVDELRRCGAPVDAFGVGTNLVAAPSLGFIYKLVAIENASGEMVPVAKQSATADKSTRGGEKSVISHPDGRKSVGQGADVRTVAIRDGVRLAVGLSDIHEARERVMRSIALAGAAAPAADDHAGRRRRALIAVDLQNDFCEGGSLAVEGGAEVARKADEMLRKVAGRYDLVITTRDWHTPATADHFPAEGNQPDYSTSWPRHCMAGTEGAEYHPAFSFVRDGAGTVVVEVLKGQNQAAYSGFEGFSSDGSTIGELLERHGIDSVDICGLATDYCVRATAMDALAWANGQPGDPQVRVLVDLTAPVTQTTGEHALREMRDAGIMITTGLVPSAPR